MIFEKTKMAAVKTSSAGRIDQFRYIKIQLKPIGPCMRLWGINPTTSVFIPQSLVLRSIVFAEF